MNILFFFAASISLKCGILLFDIFTDDSLVALLLTLALSGCAFLSAHILTSHGKGKTFSFIVFCILSTLFIFGENLLAVGELELMTFKPISLLYLVDLPIFVYFTYFGVNIVDGLKKRYVVISSLFLFVFFVSFVVIWNVRELKSAQTVFDNTAKTVYATNGYTKSDYFGVGKEKHVVIIEVPSLTDAVLETTVNGSPLLPNFCKFFEETLYFENFYSEIYDGSVDVQFAAINSLFPTLDNSIAEYHGNTFNSLANILNRRGYRTASISTMESGLYNREAILRSCGFEKVDVSPDDSTSLDNVANNTAGRIKTFQYVTLGSSAAPYVYSEAVETSCTGVIADMLSSLVEADRIFGEFIEKMKECGGYERTVIAVFGTATELSIHKRGSLSSYGKFTEKEYLGLETYCAPFGIRVPTIKSARFDIVSSIYDVFPTLMDVLGETDEYMLVYGDSALRTGDTGDAYFVLGDTHRGSYVDGDHIYIKVRNGNDQIFNSDLSYASLSSCLSRSKEVIRMVGECELFYKKNIFKNLTTNTFSEIVEENEHITLILPQNEIKYDVVFYRDELLKKGDIVPFDEIDGTLLNLEKTKYGVSVKNVLESVSNETMGKYLLGEMDVGSSSVALAPFGDGELYCSFLIDGEYTEYHKMDAVGEWEKVSISLGKATVVDGKKIEKIRVIVRLEGEDVFWGLNIVVGDERATGTSDEQESMMLVGEGEMIYPENDDEIYSWLLEKIESKLLGDSDGEKVSSIYELIGKLKKKEILAFFDNYDKAMIKEAMCSSAVVTAVTKNGKLIPIVGFDGDKLFTTDTNGEIIKFDENDWEGRVMVAIDNERELIIIEDFIPIDALIRPGYVNEDKRYIVIHNTGNYSADSDAKMHALYIQNQAASATPREASWHYTVDDKVVYYHIPDNENAWHAGDGNFGNGNYYGIGIEICVNGFPEVYSGAEYEEWLVQFKAALDNAAKLTAHLMVKYDLDMSSIKQHYDFARNKKNCPMQMRYNSQTGTFERDTGDMWIYFLEKTEAEFKKMK